LTRPYYLPGFFVKVLGALGVGVLYFFYYGGGNINGDTFYFFKDAGKIVDAFIDSPIKGIKVLLATDEYDPSTYAYTSRIYYYQDPTSRPIVKIAGVLSLFTFHTYSVTALLFAAFCFGGVWAIYNVFVDLYPPLYRPLAIAILFVPSVFFWGSGLLKDTITLGCLGYAFNAFYFGLIKRRQLVRNGIIFLICLLIIKAVKVYILLCFIPAVSLWLFLQDRTKMKKGAARTLMLPLALLLALPIGYVAVQKITEGTRYSLDQIANTTQVTAEWLQYMSEYDQGSGYSLGEFDGSMQSVITKLPQGIWVSLFRPYLWEAHNVVMLLSAFESLILLLLTIKVLFEVRFRIIKPLLEHPVIAFCFLFAIVLAFGVGVSSSNFGTLSRYRVPLLPFYLAGLYLLRFQVKRSRKLF
ncbi:MAG: hypothetical protein AAF734_08090, partial [Bacteroidota bacterium]